MRLTLLDEGNPEFPPPTDALVQPDGLLAVGGNLAPDTLIRAYRNGIFPWYQDNDPILWWSPSRRCILRPCNFHVSSSLRRILRRNFYYVTSNVCFRDVVLACSRPRGDGGTWITSEMVEAYCKLHQLGNAHSIEVWDGDDLVGGIYGVLTGCVFSGESMFSAVSNGSKIAMAYLCQYMISSNMTYLDCQIENPHLMTLGAQFITRSSFIDELVNNQEASQPWEFNSYSNWVW